MTELANLALISRSGMTRRVARLVAEGLVSRCSADADARGVIVSLTDAGIERLTETAPVHARGARSCSLPSVGCPYLKERVAAAGHDDAARLRRELHTLLAGSIALGVANRTSTFVLAARDAAVQLLEE